MTTAEIPARPLGTAAPVRRERPTAEALNRDPRRPLTRVRSLDVLRGLAIVILFLAINPGPREGLPAQLKHSYWHGLTVADLFFPVFLFAVGAAMVFSARTMAGRHVARRAALLTAIGIALVSVKQGELTFPGVLQHIAIAYVLAWLVMKLPVGWQLVACAAALVAYAAAFVLFADGTDAWGRSGTLAHTVNGWFFGAFRTEGIPQSAISFINVMAGVFAGRLVSEGDRSRIARTAAVWAGALIGLGALMTAVVPINKYLWSPSYAVVTSGSSLALFALAYWLVDVRGVRRGVQPMVELGSNPIVLYVVCMLSMVVLPPHRGPIDRLVDGASPTVVALVWAVAWLAVGWLLSHVLYRRRIFVKI